MVAYVTLAGGAQWPGQCAPSPLWVRFWPWISVFGPGLDLNFWPVYIWVGLGLSDRNLKGWPCPACISNDCSFSDHMTDLLEQVIRRPKQLIESPPQPNQLTKWPALGLSCVRRAGLDSGT